MDMSSYKVEPHHHHDKLFQKKKRSRRRRSYRKKGGGGSMNEKILELVERKRDVRCCCTERGEAHHLRRSNISKQKTTPSDAPSFQPCDFLGVLK